MEAVFLSRTVLREAGGPRNLFVEAIEGLLIGKVDELEEMVG